VVALLRRNARIELLKQVPLFSRCTKAQLAAIAQQSDELSVPEGRALTRQGQRGREFVVLIDGEAEVRKNGRKVATLGPGDFVGEMALITGAPRMATVTTTAPARLLVLTDRAFRNVLQRMPNVQGSLLQAVSERLQGDLI
jgi:CRP/FNR family transcriptional regulator, cyclic AMP receptor protein